MRQFMGNHADQKEKEVTTTFDPSVIHKRSTTKRKEIDDHNGKIGNDLSNMALSMSMGKDERIFKMIVEYDKGNLVSISSVANLLNVSYATAKKYGKEAGIKLYDDKSKIYTNGRIPKLQ